MSRSSALLLALAGVWSATALILALAPARASADTDPFRAATCGVGMGASVAPSWSFFTLDARAQSRCESEDWPIPGLACTHPRHGTTAWNAPPLD